MTLLSEERFNQILENFHSLKPILVLGDVGVDKYTYGSVNRISPEAPVPVLEVEQEWHQLGLAANVANNLTGLDVACTLCGVVGDDRFSTLFEDLLDDLGIKSWGIVRENGRPTTYKERVITNTQQICRIDYETKEPISKDLEKRLFQRVEDLMKDSDSLILQDYAKGVFTDSLCTQVIKIFNEAGKLVAVDPSRSTPPSAYRGAGLLKPNLGEAKRLVTSLGYETIKVSQMANILVDKLKVQKLIITLGPEGMAVFEPEKMKEMTVIPTMATEVFDVSGAGDTAISTILASLNAGATLEEAAWMGNIASGVVVAKKGTARTNQAELKNFYQRLKTQMESGNHVQAP